MNPAGGRSPAAPSPAPPPGDRLAGQITTNTLLSVSGRALYVAGWALLAPLMLNQLGSDRFGLWSLLSVFAGLYLSADLGLAGTLTRFVADCRARGDRDRLRSVYTIGVALYAALSIVALGVVVLLRHRLLDAFQIAPGILPEARAALIAAAVTYGLLNGSMLIASVLGGLQRMDVWNRISMATTVLQLAGATMILLSGGGLVALLANTAVALVAGVLWGRSHVKRLAPEIGFDVSRVDLAQIRGLMSYGVALQVINAGVLVQFQLDKVLFGSMLSLRSAGEYELAHRSVTALWSVPALMLPPLLPAAAHLAASGDHDRVVRLYRRSTRYVLAAAFPIAAGIIVLAPVLCSAWLGPGHGQAASAMAALAAMLAVNVLTGTGTAIARGLGRPGLELRYHALAIALHVSASLALIPRLGYAGGLWALFASTSIASLYFVAAFHRRFGEPLGPFLRRIVLPPLAAAALGGAAASLVALGPRDALLALPREAALVRLLAGTAIVAIVSGSAMLLFRYISREEIGSMMAVRPGRGAGGDPDAA